MEKEKLNLIPNGFKQTCYCSQGDDGRVIRFELLEGISPYILDGSEVITNSVKKPNGDTIINSVPNTEQAYIDVTIGADITELAGVAEGEVTITKAGAVIGTQNYILEIEADAYGADVEQRTATGIIATFTTNIIDTLEIEADIEPKQDLNGYSSPFIDSDEVNRVPYLKRAVNGTASRIGNKLYDKLVGGTVAFNQILPLNNDSWNLNGLNFTALNGRITTNSIVTNSGTFSILPSRLYGLVKPVYNHKYFLSYNGSNNFESLQFAIYGDTTQYAMPNNSQTSKLFNCTVQNVTDAEFVVRAEAGNNYLCDFTSCLIDLTQMLGATIADYIYSLEQATEGAGVAFFKALGFDKDYYPYNSGELMSVKATAHILRDASDNIIGNYALDSNLELRGMLKLDENNSPYYDGDTYEASGAVNRKYAKIDLNTQTWSNITSASNYAYIMLNDRKEGADNNYIVNLPSIILRSRMNSANLGFVLEFETGAFNSTDELKTALANSKLVYELATPTTEQATAFTNPQNVIEGGTEEYTDNRAVPIPVGHETYHANICEISGATECTIVRDGKNLNSGLEQVTIEASSTSISPTITREFLQAGFTYTISCYQESALSSNVRNTLRLNKVGDTNITYYESTLPNYHLAKGLHTLTVTIQSSGFYDIVFWGHSLSSSTVYSNFQIELGSEASAYEAYTGAEIVIDLNGTIYGGKVDTNGLLTVTKACAVFNGSETWYYSATYNRVYTNISATKINSAFISNELKNNPAVADYNGYINDQKNLIIYAPASITSVADWQAWLGSNPLEVCFELAEPIEVQLTGAELESLLGVNNVWASTGAVKVNYLYRATDEA